MKSLINFTSQFKILKFKKTNLIISALLGSATISFAAPSGGTVTSGTASISQNGNVTNINQSTSKATINWNKFNIASNESVNFKQPDVNSITLNRVIGNEKSIINGALNANGQVWLLNANGVLFGKNASVNTAGILASTAELSDSDFNAGNYNFKNSSSNSVINEGTITVSNAGSVILASNEVRNSGTIKAVRGKVHLVGADSYSLNLNGNSLVNLKVDKGVLDSLVENSGTILADGGEIYLTTNAVDELLRGVVNNTGILEANSLDGVTGYVEVFAHGGTANVAGSIEAVDGFVETSGKDFLILEDASIKAKEWLIDPVDITVESTGSTSDLGGSSIKASFIESTLNDGTGVTLTATNDININENISWTDSLFTLTATNDININAVMSASSTASLALNGDVNVAFNPGVAQGFKGRVDLSIANILINGDTYTVIGDDITTLQNITLSGKYVLGANVDASATSGWNSGSGFESIGSFGGIFNGLGHSISDLFINRPTELYIGLFGKTDSANISNLALVDTNISGGNHIGGIVGFNYYNSSISNSYITGIINGNKESSNTGGLVGFNSTSSSITNSYSTAKVSSNSNSSKVGGLVGKNYDSSITNSYATGQVTGIISGGLIGHSSDMYILNSYAIGEVVGTISGGLIGSNNSTINNSYSIGNVIGNGLTIGGLVGSNTGNISNSFWDKETSGQLSSDGGIGKATAQMKIASTFTDVGWSVSGSGTGTVYPILNNAIGATDIWVLPTYISYTLSDVGTGEYTYDGEEVTLSSLNWTLPTIFSTDNWILGSDYNFSYDSSSISGFTNAGTYSNIGVNILKEGYSLSNSGNTNGSLVIDKADITAITGIIAENKIYDGTTVATLDTTNLSFIGMVENDSLTVRNSLGTFDTKDVGTSKIVNITGLTLSGIDKDNYNLTTLTSTAIADITAKNISAITGITASDKTYDGTTAVILDTTNPSFIGMIINDNLILSDGIGEFDDKNVGTSKIVNITNLTLGGTDKDNYNLRDNMATTTANIVEKRINYNFGDGVEVESANGSEYLLNELFSKSTLFGDNSSLISNDDYQFIYKGNSVRGFIDANTYYPISLRFLNNNFLLGDSNHNGSVLIKDKPTFDFNKLIPRKINSNKLNFDTTNNIEQIKRINIILESFKTKFEILENEEKKRVKEILESLY